MEYFQFSLILEFNEFNIFQLLDLENFGENISTHLRFAKKVLKFYITKKLKDMIFTIKFENFDKNCLKNVFKIFHKKFNLEIYKKN